MNNSTIFHYTNLDAFKSIIEKGEIWFTRIDCLNDFSEYIYYREILKKSREEFILERGIKHQYDLTFINRYVDNVLIKIRDDYYKKTFTFSLSNNGDSIPMWNYYSEKSGIAIGFDKMLLFIELGKRIAQRFTLLQCDIEYNVVKQIDIIKSKFDEILKTANDPELFHDKDISKTVNKAKIVLGDMWIDSYIFKEKSFEYENEYRIALFKLGINNDNNNISEEPQYIVTGHNIKPIIKIKVAENWNDIITNIVISPYNESKNIVENVHDFLNSNNINIEESKIIKSKCPVRNF